MDDLKHALSDYRDFTIKTCTSLESDDFDSLDDLINKREEIIYHIGTLKYDLQEFKAICEELKLEELNRKLNCLALEKRQELRKNIARRPFVHSSLTGMLAIMVLSLQNGLTLNLTNLRGLSHCVASFIGVVESFGILECQFGLFAKKKMIKRMSFSMKAIGKIRSIS